MGFAPTRTPSAKPIVPPGETSFASSSARSILARMSNGERELQAGAQFPMDNVRVEIVLDSDDDGVSDREDNCPSLPNPHQADCDTNGVPDESDPDFDGDGAPDTCDDDIDEDGIENGPDRCDYTPSGAPIVTEPQSPFHAALRADLDGDCDVDTVDFAIMQSEFTGPN